LLARLLAFWCMLVHVCRCNVQYCTVLVHTVCWMCRSFSSVNDGGMGGLLPR
jgi:hypothetical protein